MYLGGISLHKQRKREEKIHLQRKALFSAVEKKSGEKWSPELLINNRKGEGEGRQKRKNPFYAFYHLKWGFTNIWKNEPPDFQIPLWIWAKI